MPLQVDQERAPSRPALKGLRQSRQERDVYPSQLQAGDCLLTSDDLGVFDESLEISLLSRHCFSLAQKFNAFYHRYPVIREPDHNRKLARMLLVYLYREQMLESLETLGIPVPERM